MEPPWMVWMRHNMPADLYNQYIEDTKTYQAWVYSRLKKLEELEETMHDRDMESREER